MSTPIAANNQLKKLLLNRQSFRDFSGKPFKLSDLSEILYYAAGIVRHEDNDKKRLRRPYPSAGAKYPLEIYLLILGGHDIKQGLYHYNPLMHYLEVLLTPVLAEEIENIWMSQKWFRKASVILFITACYTRTTDKYGEAGLPFPFLESGHLVQNIYLLCQSVGIGCCAIGQFKEKELVRLLDINPNKEYPIYYIALEGR